MRPPLAAQRRDLGDAREILATWLGRHLPNATDLRLSEVRMPDAGGVANETLLFDARWEEDRASRSAGFVARVESSTFLFMEAHFDLHPRMMQALSDEPGIPVPKVFGYEPDTLFLGAPFFVMEKIDGNVPGDAPPYNETGWLVEASPDERRRMWRDAVEVLARLHAVPTEKVAFLEHRARGATGLEQFLRYWLESFEWAVPDRAHPVLAHAADWLEANLPDHRPTSLAWGDARIGNMIFRDSRCVAVLDWDMMSLAGGEADLAWWILFDHASSAAYGFERLAGLGTAEETVDLWEQLTGGQARDLDYHLVFAAFRMAIALIRVAQILRGSGGLPAEVADQMELNNQAVQYLISMLALEPVGPVTVTWPGLHHSQKPA